MVAADFVVDVLVDFFVEDRVVVFAFDALGFVVCFVDAVGCFGAFGATGGGSTRSKSTSTNPSVFVAMVFFFTFRFWLGFLLVEYNAHDCTLLGCDRCCVVMSCNLPD